MAEKEGFEPSIPFWGIHDFQSCALGQLRDFSMSSAHADLDILLHSLAFVKKKFHFSQKKFLPCQTVATLYFFPVLRYDEKKKGVVHFDRNAQAVL